MPRTNMPRPPSGKRIAGVSLSWWVVGGLGAVGVVYFAMHRTQKDATTPDNPAMDPATGYDPTQSSIGDEYGYGSIGAQGLTPSAQGAGTTTINIAAPALPRTNADWFRMARKGLADLHHHGYTYTAVTAALSAYLISAPLYPGQVAIVEAAVAKYGPPPNPPVIHQIPYPPKKPKK